MSATGDKRDEARYLDEAALVIMAPPNAVSTEGRRAAEEAFVRFRSSKAPYGLCREILENGRADLAVFEAADVLKHAVIREWSELKEEDVRALRQYLLQYLVGREPPAFVRERIVQVIAIMVKRAGVDDFGAERSRFVTEVERLIENGIASEKVLGFRLVTALLQEYATTVKSVDVGLAWEVHYKEKKQFERFEMQRVFGCCLRVLAAWSDEREVVRAALAGAEAVLTWGYMSPLLPRRVIGLFETVYESEQAPALRLRAPWKDTVCDERFLPVMFGAFWKVRADEQLAHHALNCLAQLASLNGAALGQKEARLQYLRSYLDGFLELAAALEPELSAREAQFAADAFRKLVMFFPPALLAELGPAAGDAFLGCLVGVTCRLAAEASRDDELEGGLFREAFDHALEAWLSVISAGDVVFRDGSVREGAARVFESYLQWRLSSSGGGGGGGGGGVGSGCEDDRESDDDRIDCAEQLESVGALGRFAGEMTVPLLCRLLEERRDDDEAAHWLLLAAGHVVCAGDALPPEMARLSARQAADLSATAAVLTHNNINDDIYNDAADWIARLGAAALRMGTAQVTAPPTSVSPQTAASTAWFLSRWATCCVPAPDDAGAALVSALGPASPGAENVALYLVRLARAYLTLFPAERQVTRDAVALLLSVAERRPRGAALVALTDADADDAHGHGRGVARAAVAAGAGLEPDDAYWERALAPRVARFLQPNDDRPESAVDATDALCGAARGAVCSTAGVVFRYLRPALRRLPECVARDYQPLVRAALDLLTETARRLLPYLDLTEEALVVYETALETVRAYSDRNRGVLSSSSSPAVTDTEDDLALFLELLAELTTGAPDALEAAADTCLAALQLLLPLVTVDLLRYPRLCGRYYRALALVNDAFPDHVCRRLPEHVLRPLFASVDLGLGASFGTDVLTSCLDFVQVAATHLCRRPPDDCENARRLAEPLLDRLLQLVLQRHIPADMYSVASTSLFALICCFPARYEACVRDILAAAAQRDPVAAERLAAAFADLLRGFQLDPGRALKLRFRERFDTFVVNVHGFLLVK